MGFPWKPILRQELVSYLACWKEGGDVGRAGNHFAHPESGEPQCALGFPRGKGAGTDMPTCLQAGECYLPRVVWGLQ